jgi:UPF0755 protein
MRRFIIALIVLALLGTGAFFAEQWSLFAPGPPAPHGRATIVWIKPGEGSAAIGQQLQSAGVVRNGALFRLGVRLRGMNAALKAGEYAIPSAASMADVMGILIEGKSIQHRITAAEGLTSRMIYDIVDRDAALVGSTGAVPAEGTLLPETYLFVRGTTRAQMLARMATAQQRLLAKLWPGRAPNLPFKSPADAVTLASIVEKETAIPEERRHVAAVFINRLRLGMKLQSDPTIIYGISGGYPLGRGIRESELAAATPYNTYVVAGLPPTPICNPGRNSISAVLQPETSSDLYFVANGTGGHVFTSSIAEHEKNVARWRQIEPRMKAAPAPPSAPALPNLNGGLRGTGENEAAAPAPAAAPSPPKPRTHRRHSHRRPV